MVKRLIFGLAENMLVCHGSFIANIKRVQGGFMTDQNLQQARKSILAMQKTLDEIEYTLNHPPPDDVSKDNDHVPLK
jgi:hypothetical protein